MTRTRAGGTAESVLVPALVLLTLILLALTGCASTTDASTQDAARSASRRATQLASSLAPSVQARTDAPVWVAAQFEHAHCAWNWQHPRQAYLAAQQKLATADYARQLAVASDPVSWRDQVLAQKQTVTCTVSDATRDADAPTTTTAVYVRMSVNTEITSTLGAFAGGEQIASWLVVRTAAGWRVAGSFEGG